MTNRNTQQRHSVQPGIREPGPGHLPEFLGCCVTVVALVTLVRSLGRASTRETCCPTQHAGAEFARCSVNPAESSHVVPEHDLMNAPAAVRAAPRSRRSRLPIQPTTTVIAEGCSGSR